MYLDPERIAAERKARYTPIARQLNNLFLQFKCLTPNAVGWASAIVSTPSVADIYDMFLKAPHVYTLSQVMDGSRWHPRTIKRALKRLKKFHVIIEEDGLWALNIAKAPGGSQ